MQAIQESNGNITFRLEDDDAEMIARFEEQAQLGLDHFVMAHMLDHFGFLGNAKYLPILPEHIGALTDAPMFTNDLVVHDCGRYDVQGDVWYYPDYMVKAFSTVLQIEGQVTFRKAMH